MIYEDWIEQRYPDDDDDYYLGDPDEDYPRN